MLRRYDNVFLFTADRTVSFRLPEYAVNEVDGLLEIELVLNLPVQNNFDIKVKVGAGTAQGEL